MSEIKLEVRACGENGYEPAVALYLITDGAAPVVSQGGVGPVNMGGVGPVNEVRVTSG